MTDDSELSARAAARIGTVLRGKYRLVGVLGVGGMATVYRAKHRNQAEFAVKILHAELSLHPGIRTRFVREGYAANSVKHPGVVRVVDDDVDEDGQAFLVMDLLEGQGLEALHERAGGRVRPAIACALAVQLLDILAAAHANQIVHRDIKPANLFVTREGELKVLDFGIARARDEAMSASATGSGVLLGTPAFMSPEQASGQTDAIDARSDVWSVGATLFTLLSGEYVHGQYGAMQLVISVATKPARSLATLLPGVDARVVDVVDRALAFSPSDRWPSARAMGDALAAATVAAFGAMPTREMLAGWLEEEGPTEGAPLRAVTPPFSGENLAVPAVSEPVLGSQLEEHGVESTLPGPPLAPPPRPRSIPAPPSAQGATTTARPVSSAPSRIAPPEAPGPRSSGRGAWKVVVGGGVVALVAGASWLVASSHPMPSAATSAVVSTSAPLVPTEAAAVPSVSVVAPVAALPPAASVETEPVSPTPSVRAVPPRIEPPGPTWKRPVTASPPRAAATRPTAPPASTAPNCTPNYSLDADGTKHFKPECF